MNLDELYAQVKLKRSGLKADVFRHKRHNGRQWKAAQQEVYLRDRGLCQSPLQPPVCTGKIEVLNDRGHVDHILPLTCGGTNHIDNLRLLCPVCHALRADRHHEGLRGKMIKLDQMPNRWNQHLWEG